MGYDMTWLMTPTSPTPRSSDALARNPMSSDLNNSRSEQPLATGAEPSVWKHSSGIERNSCLFNWATIVLVTRWTMASRRLPVCSTFAFTLLWAPYSYVAFALTAATDTHLSAPTRSFIRLLIYSQLLHLASAPRGSLLTILAPSSATNRELLIICSLLTSQ